MCYLLAFDRICICDKKMEFTPYPPVPLPLVNFKLYSNYYYNASKIE
jgi:hypothetical protein